MLSIETKGKLNEFHHDLTLEMNHLFAGLPGIAIPSQRSPLQQMWRYAGGGQVHGLQGSEGCRVLSQQPTESVFIEKVAEKHE